MKVLVIFAHPQQSSFCGAVLQRFTRALEEAGHEVRVRDLYALHFNPVLSEDEYECQRKGGTSAPAPADVVNEQTQVLWADAVAFVCPLWWGDVPAILKGWFDRVWTQGFAWSYERDAILQRMQPASGLLLVTAGADDEKLASDGILSAVTAVLNDRLLNGRFRSARAVLLPGLDTADPEQRTRLLERAQEAAKAFGDIR